MKRLNELMKSLGLDPKKEWSIFLVGLILVIALFGCGYFFLLKEILVLAVGITCLILYLAFFSTRYERLSLRSQKQKLSQFVESMNYFEAYLGFGYTAYQALEEVAGLAKKEIASFYATLLKEMEGDKGVMPFLRFADHFESLEVRQAMLLIYELGGKKPRKTAIFSTLIERMEESYGRQSNTEMAESMDSFKVFPLLSGGASVLALAIAIIRIIGGIYNVI